MDTDKNVEKKVFSSRRSFLKAHARGEKLDDGMADVRNADLSNLSLVNIDLKDINFSGSVMTNMSLIGANLTNSDLTGVNLSSSDLREACLLNAILVDATADYTNFDGCNLDHTSMALASWHEAIFTNTKVLGTYFKNDFVVAHNGFEHKAFKDMELHYIYSDKEPLDAEIDSF